MGLKEIRVAAEGRRILRWARERAEQDEKAAGKQLASEIAAWRKTTPENLTFSNVCCSRAPADLGCVYVKSWNPMRNPCIFCGGMEDDIL